jgi:hypothetical protein
MNNVPTRASFDITAIARSYNVLAHESELRILAEQAFPGRSLERKKKADLHQLINTFLFEQFRGESALKAKLVQQFLDQDVVAAFEIKVNKSRVDFLTINGQTKSFEIKSELDNLQKLPKQISDYQRVFDYNYIVIDEKHYNNALRLIHPQYGIQVLHGNALLETRPAMLNRQHDPLAQLSLFTKKEFAQTFRIPGITKEEALINFTTEEINDCFKAMLKNRYVKRWRFLLSHQRQILPIDFQYFFQHNIAPAIIYGLS